MSAAELRQAAETLRGLAEKATPGVWKVWGMSVMADVVGDSNHATALDVAHTTHEAGLRTFNAHYIARVDPRLGLALADWLDESAESRQAAEDLLGTTHFSTSKDARPLAIARLINGEAS